MTPYEQVLAQFEFPFDLYPFQSTDVNELGPLPSTGLYYEPGLGKTPTSTAIALFKRLMGTQVTLIIVPPTIITQWARWLNRIKQKNGSKFKIMCYRGSPKERAKLSFDADFILVGMQIFKKDYEHILAELAHKKVHVILDEAQCIKDVGTENYKRYRDFVTTQSHTLLTGTPLNKPDDAYSYIKLVAPGVYRTLAQFNQLHIKAVDFFGKPVEYQNLDLLASNLTVNASRKTKEENLVGLPTCTIQPVEYDLAPKHLALYRKLVTEQLLKLPDGDKIDLTAATALYHAVGQIIMQWSYFAQDESLKAEGYNVIEEILDELGSSGKLIVFANYTRTNQELVRRFKCPGVWGEINAKGKQLAIDTFIDDDKCRMLVLNPVAGGVGVDGLQLVACNAFYAEPPITPSAWTQSLSRIHRDGQRRPVTIRMGMALGTCQPKLVRSLSDKEALVNPLQGSKAELQAALFGEVECGRLETV